MAVIEQQEAAPAKSGPSVVVQVAVLLVLTGAAVGMGWFSGGYLDSTRTGQSSDEHNPTRIDKAHVKTTDKAATRKDGEEKAEDNEPGVLPIEAITTNLAAPSDVWVRMELSLVFDGEPDQALGEQIHQDFLAFMRTVKLPQVEGASGFQHLKEDLTERARIRSNGRVKDILIKTLLFE
jgi:flagellar FliL protein